MVSSRGYGDPQVQAVPISKLTLYSLIHSRFCILASHIPSHRKTMAFSRTFSACSAPRAHLFSARYTRPFITITPRLQESNPFGGFGGGPAPPRLPKEEQDLFEELQKQSTGAFSTPRAPPKINQSPDATAVDRAEAESAIDSRADKISDTPPSKFKEGFNKIISARGKGEELHPNVRMGSQPEFDGDKNPKTGEVGGPKNEPLRWGAGGEWTYNGRTTDF